MNRKNMFLLLSALFAISLGVGASFGAEEDKGETKEMMALKNRVKPPATADIDNTITIETLLGRQDADPALLRKGAQVEGYVIQVEKEEDGDVHLSLATAPGEWDTRKWIIVEATPATQKRAGLSAASLRKLRGHHVRVTGWLFFEPDSDDHDPRGTRWEIHPATSIVRLDS